MFGEGVVNQLGELVREYGGSHVVLVTDPGLVEAGHVEHACRALQDANVNVVMFDQVRENPTTRDVDRCLEVARSTDIDFIVALGGGSAMDCAKGCNFLLTGGGEMKDYWGVGKATKPMLPLIAVPTTTGTGSELQSFALIADDITHQKMACGDRKAAAKVALLDPALAVSQPREVIACSGLDTIAHAVETAVTTRRTPISLLFSHEAFRRADRSFPRILDDPNNIAAMGNMLLAASYAGLAIENSMLGGAHSMANPLTALFNIAHGQAVGMVLPHIVAFNAEQDEARWLYDALVSSSQMRATSSANGALSSVDRLVDRLNTFIDLAGLPRTLSACDVPATAVRELAESAATQWTAQFNPRPLTTDDFEQLYNAAL